MLSNLKHKSKLYVSQNFEFDRFVAKEVTNNV